MELCRKHLEVIWNQESKHFSMKTNFSHCEGTKGAPRGCTSGQGKQQLFFQPENENCEHPEKMQRWNIKKVKNPLERKKLLPTAKWWFFLCRFFSSPSHTLLSSQVGGIRHKNDDNEQGHIVIHFLHLNNIYFLFSKSLNDDKLQSLSAAISMSNATEYNRQQRQQIEWRKQEEKKRKTILRWRLLQELD